MSTELIISIVGAFTAILVSSIGAILAKRNNVILQIRKIKEQHYISFIECLHNDALSNSNESVTALVLSRDKMLLTASENVINHIINYETNGIGKPSEIHNKHLTSLIREMRKDLKIKDKNFPTVGLKKPI